MIYSERAVVLLTRPVIADWVVAAGRLVPGSVAPGRPAGGRQWCLAGRPCERSCLVPPPWLPRSAGPMTAHSGIGRPAPGLTGRLSERGGRQVAGIVVVM